MNLKGQYGQTPLVFVMGNFVPGVDNNENLSITEYFNRRFSHGNDLLIIDSLLKLRAKFDRAEYVYLLSIVEN
ncbi:hypothetical protein IHO40_03220 [Wolbachia endosymbiont of Mansonella ozzardi]|uniref:hypothetical protein n=1 Tax=Wolbachia endosymbiont of Mansonella ozzardi TaxID=137464 RepID=UPI001CE1F186|nr:hypothetical protein [Wolbachia endosymbiont of Mansonella ozzardi]MCA4775110.1 hypothetical protein [Wolbachia endosymbiont of Mansonella ozzardi]